MLWSYNKLISIVPQIYLNFSKHGIRTQIGSQINPTPPNRMEEHVAFGMPKIRPGIESNIFTEDVSKVTSQNMQGIKEAILLAHKQRTELASDIIAIRKDLEIYQKKLRWSYILLYGLVIKSIRDTLKDSIANQRQAITAIEQYISDSSVALTVSFESKLQSAYNALVENFEHLCKSRKIWDLTATYKVDRFATRSYASNEVYRKEVALIKGDLPDIKSELKAMVFQNANGADLYFYPNFIVMWNHRKEFAIVGIDEIDIEVRVTRFVEDGPVPSDSRTVGKTWSKVNKNGSPDLRFKGNYQIPIVEYADVTIKTKTGMNELYQFSSVPTAEAFVKAFIEYQIQVIHLEYVGTVET